MAKEPNKKPRNNRGALMVAFIIILAIVNGVKFYVDEQKKKEQEAFAQDLQDELVEKSNELVRLQYDLDLKIEEIKKLDGDVSDLEQLKGQLELEQRRLQKRENRTREELADLSERVEGFRALLLEKDAEIERLAAINEELRTENNTLKEETNSLQDSINSINRTSEEMQAKIDVAARLRAENARAFGVNKRGREREGSFRNRQIETLKVTFNIAENSVATKEAIDVLIRVIEPGGNVLFDVATTSGTFMVEGRELFYTAKQTILFDNTRQGLTFEYVKGSKYVKGEHTVEIYCDDYFIGATNFTIK